MSRQDMEEDAISLGDDEDDQYLFQEDVTMAAPEEAPAPKAPTERPSDARSREGSVGANDSYSRFSYRERDRYEDSRSRPTRSPRGSPPRSSRDNSRNYTSPQQTRVTHALPPKPVTAAPYIPPSAIVEATSMTKSSPRATSRDAKRANGPSHGRSPSPRSHAEGPSYRESRRPRSNSRERYYSAPQEPAWNNSVSSIPSSRHGLSSSQRSDSRTAGRTPLSSADSDTYHSQTSRHPQRERDPPRGAKYPQNDYGPLPADLPEQDRHYRPSAPVHSAPRQSEPSDVSRGRYAARPSYDRPPSPSPPPRAHRRNRSLSPRPSNDIRSAARYRDDDPHPGSRAPPRGRDRDSFTNIDEPPRGDVRPLAGRPTWSNEPIRGSEPDFVARNGRDIRNMPARARSPAFDKMDVDSDLRPRSPRRGDDIRGPPRDREPIRRTDSREPERTMSHQGYSSAPRSFPREDDRGREYPPYRDDIQPLSHPAPPPLQRERSDRPRFDRTASSGGPPYQSSSSTDRQSFNTRMPEYEPRPAAYDNNRRPESQYDRGNRGDLPRERDLPREPPREPLREQASFAREAPRLSDARYEPRSSYDRPVPEDSHRVDRRRDPLPSQSSHFPPASNGMYRDPPPHVPVSSLPPPSNAPVGRSRYSDIPPQNNAYDGPPPQHMPGRPRVDSNKLPPTRPATDKRIDQGRDRALYSERDEQLPPSRPRTDKRIDQGRMPVDRAQYSERDEPPSRMDRFGGMQAPSVRDDRRPFVPEPPPRNHYPQSSLPPRAEARLQHSGSLDDTRGRRPPSPRGGDTRMQPSFPPPMDDRDLRAPSPVPRRVRPIFNGHGPEVPKGPRLGRIDYPAPKPAAANPPKTMVPPEPIVAKNVAKPASETVSKQTPPAVRPGAGESREDNGYSQRNPRRDGRRPVEEGGRSGPPPRPAASGPNSVPISGTRRMPSSSSSGPAPVSAAPPAPPAAALPSPVVHPLPAVPPAFNPGAMPPPSALIKPPAPRALVETIERITASVADVARDDSMSVDPSPVTVSTQGMADLVIVSRPEAAPAETKRKGTRFSAPKDKSDKETSEASAKETQSQTVTRRYSVSSLYGTSLPVHASLPSKPVEAAEAKPEGNAAPPRQSRFADKQPNPEPTTAPASGKAKEEKEAPAPASSSWSARMMESGDKPAPTRRHEGQKSSDDLSNRLSQTEDRAKPPRHRKMDRRHGGDGSNSFSSAPPPVEEPLSFQKAPTLLQRLSFDDHGKHSMLSPELPSPSLRDRIVPAKRDHDHLEGDSRDASHDVDEGNESKRARRKGGSKSKRGGGGGRR